MRRWAVVSAAAAAGCGRVAGRGAGRVCGGARTSPVVVRGLCSRPELAAVPPGVRAKIGRNLHRQANHPLHIIQTAVVDHMNALATDRFHHTAIPPHAFTLINSIDPVVTCAQNFDQLRIPHDHVSRSPTDTFYVDNPVNHPRPSEVRLLRCHTSAHQTELMRQGHSAFLVAGDVYRRDAVDRSHYPVFHQMEGVRLYSAHHIPALAAHLKVDVGEGAKAVVLADLKNTLETLARALFGSEVPLRWVDENFPFTDPSAELEVMFQGEWLEVLGCGVIHDDVMRNGGREDEVGYAFGLGLERLAMVLFGIPDIRLFWSEDERFLSQFRDGHITQFEAYSKFPVCYKDVTFWLPARDFHSHHVFELVREIAGDLVEDVRLIDDFTHPKTGRTSHCYRISYRSMDRSLTNAEIDQLQFALREALPSTLGVELR